MTAWLNLGAGGSCPLAVGRLSEVRRRTCHALVLLDEQSLQILCNGSGTAEPATRHMSSPEYDLKHIVIEAYGRSNVVASSNYAVDPVDRLSFLYIP